MFLNLNTLHFWKEIRVSINGGTPESSILIGFSPITHPFGGTPIDGNLQIKPVPWAQQVGSLPSTSPRPGKAELFQEILLVIDLVTAAGNILQ